MSDQAEPGSGAAFDREDLDLFDREREVGVETTQPDGSPRRTVIWIVVANGVPYIRSWLGERGKWYQDVVADPHGAIHADGRRFAFTAVPVSDPATIQACSDQLQAKYAGDSATPGMVRPEVLGTTLRLVPDTPA